MKRFVLALALLNVWLTGCSLKVRSPGQEATPDARSIARAETGEDQDESPAPPHPQTDAADASTTDGEEATAADADGADERRETTATPQTPMAGPLAPQTEDRQVPPCESSSVDHELRPEGCPLPEPVVAEVAARFVARDRGGIVFGKVSGQHPRLDMVAIAYLRTDLAWLQSDSVADVARDGSFAIPIHPGRAWEEIYILIIPRDGFHEFPSRTDPFVSSYFADGKQVIGRAVITRKGR